MAKFIFTDAFYINAASHIFKRQLVYAAAATSTAAISVWRFNWFFRISEYVCSPSGRLGRVGWIRAERVDEIHGCPAAIAGSAD
jgi:hypothetical protein